VTFEKGGKGAIFKITAEGKVTLVISEAQRTTPTRRVGCRHRAVRRGKFILVPDMKAGSLVRLPK
jgi:hypothetical protein